jgi:hypothetical protein
MAIAVMAESVLSVRMPYEAWSAVSVMRHRCARMRQSCIEGPASSIKIPIARAVGMTREFDSIGSYPASTLARPAITPRDGARQVITTTQA